MKPIWYFVGLILLSMGALIFIAGIFMLSNPPSTQTVLANTNPNLWWGGIMVAAGIIFILKNRKVEL